MLQKLLSGRINRFSSLFIVKKKQSKDHNTFNTNGSFKEFAESIPLATFETNLYGEIALTNSKFHELFSFDLSEDINGKPLFDLVVSEFKNDLQIYFNSVKKNTSRRSRSVLCINNNGIMFPAVINLKPVIKNKIVAGVRGVIQDLKQEHPRMDNTKNIEHVIRNIINHSNDIVFLSSENKIVMINGKFEGLFGVTQKSINEREVSFINFVIPSSRSNFLDYMDKLKTGSMQNCVLQFKATANNQEEIELEGNFLRIQLNSGIAIQGILKNHSVEKKVMEVERNLIEVFREAESAEKIKSDFLSQISHEIRTPVHSILGFSNLLEEELSEKLPQELRMAFSLINRSSNRLLRTIDLIVLMSELQSGKYKAKPISFDLYSDVIENLLPEFIIQAREKGLDFSVKNNCYRSVINADCDGIKNLFSHIFENAVKYTEYGGVYVELLSANNTHITVIVKDTGIGISEKYLQSMFKPFSQEDSGYSRKYDGNGLGLAIVNKIAEMNNATLEVSSQKGVGTEFKVNFMLN